MRRGLLAATSAGIVLVVAPHLGRAQAANGVRRLRDLYFTTQFYDGVALGDSLVRQYPRDAKIRAWYVANLVGTGATRAADSLTAKLDTASRDPWVLAARALSRHNPPVPSIATNNEAVQLARRAFALSPRDPDLAWLAAYTMINVPGFPRTDGPHTLAFIDSISRSLKDPIQLRIVRGWALALQHPFVPGEPSAPDTAGQNAGLREYAAQRARDSTNFAAYYEAGGRLRGTNDSLAIALLKHAVALAPRSPNAHAAYWAAIYAQRGPSAAKVAAVAADRASFLAVTDSAPWALDVAIRGMRYTTHEPGTAALEERILAKAPRSAWAENILLARANQWRDSLSAARDTTRLGPAPDSTIARARYIAGLEQFIGKGWSANPSARDQAILGLFFEVKDDTTYPAAKLVSVAKMVVDSMGMGAPSFRYGETARALANRKLELPYARTLAQEGLKHTSMYLRDFPGYFFTSVGDQADALDGQNATLYDHLGWIAYSQGDYAEADKNLTHALDLTKKNVQIYYDLGRLRSAQGRDDEAELIFAQGMTIRYRGVNPNRRELERLYEKKHGSIEGWEKYISALEEKERATRRAKILASRDTTRKVVPQFSLADLAGRVVKSDTLSARTVVVNFWGTWCGPCVAEMPELQQFYDKYRGDPTVAIFTISNDKDLNDLRDWMSKRRLTIPTLFDDGYVEKLAEIHAFPTTWFIDKDGKVQFTAVGNTGALMEEWGWRLEATKAGPVIQP